ncbi:class I SAM-dependent methyltransferase [Sphingomonas tabacisoli]|uniref:Class I SAM-dependent methyltransferase n=1 Tax=Sphingomonas tabacisoli TaxID=2249466 RepID=A0ABW4I2F8_9SPHN
MPKLLTRARRLARDLGVRYGVLPYKRQWVLSPEDWDREYASGKLGFYGSFRERGRYGVLHAYLTARTEPVRLLDVGCGVGLLLDRLAGVPIAEYVGIDPSAKAIEAARTDRGTAGSFHVAHLPDPALGKFDVIVCNEVLYYIEDLPAALAKLHAALNEGGWLLTSVLRHPGDIALHRAVAAEFDIVDSVLVKRQTPPMTGWTVSCYAARAKSAI